MTSPGIDYTDVTDFKRSLERFPQQVDRLVGGALGRGLAILHGWIAQYPPSTAANMPPEPYYERGYGTHPGPATSEMLGRSWTTKVTTGRNSWQGKLGTTVSYAPVVQDEERQAQVHRGRWHTVQGAVRDNRSKVVGLIRDAIRQAILLVRG